MEFFWLLAVLLGIVALYWVLPHLVKREMRRRFLVKIRKAPFAFLTFDDGPDPRATPEILDLLAEKGVKASFFALGENLDGNPRLAARIVEEGHDLGEHGQAHLNALSSWPWATWRDLSQGSRAVDRICGVREKRLFRPAYGKLNLASVVYLLKTGSRAAFWDVDPEDYRAESASRIAEDVIERLAPGRVILLHDGRREGGSDPRVTVEALRSILEAAKSKGVKFERISWAWRSSPESVKTAVRS
jgi:peptidoglycan/xylan/chitin deacetylase (PgdA/CDA1 family)